MSIEAEGIQRPHANTSQVILIFFFFFKILLFFFHSGYSESTGATARTATSLQQSPDTDVGLRSHPTTLGVEQKPGPVSRRLGKARAKLQG